MHANREHFGMMFVVPTPIQVSAGSKYDPSLVLNLPRKSGVELGR